MLQGTGSDVGKSLLVAGLARAFTNRGLRVRPFKPQNMSNNAAVTADGGEIGRAQALQARAARVQPSVHMNPVLLKPQSETGSQVVVQGRVVGNAKGREYQAMKPKLLGAVLESFGHLAREADLVLVEGAGSASEVNLRSADIANMGFARAAGVPVVLIGDIDRGGVIASLVGTKAVIAAEDAAMIAGFIVNKFRGDPSLFSEGMATIARHTGWQPLGLVPFFDLAHRLPAEDALGLQTGSSRGDSDRTLIVVLAYPRISNFDDFDPLRLEPGVNVVFIRPGQPIPGGAALVVLPGSKATIADLAALRETGWDTDLNAHVRRGGYVLGVCGGYQMLGAHISDPDGIEGPAGAVAGLGLLDVETVLGGDKVLVDIVGTSADGAAPFEGYEMHVGRTTGTGCAKPLLQFADGRKDGAVDGSGRIAGCYVHGLFSDDRQRDHWLRRVANKPSGLAYETDVEETLDRLAGHIEQHIDCNRLLDLARAPDLKQTP
ncbi:adenosylcobyric acid synthase (glutamine-hydrolysing) [Bradyrhizobium lablabi]|uniref:Cobyric acid synthase n=1 Tax=Bradyrhizobium lablabi TaxID=722472 RepID=A0A1M6SBF7_9BRAD|nr:cobyric acid synthase [Bradyrhizobium lablabi]SHK42084.1 adenosylcobyric acid synthase (glutamine-hydrolysing) [Bradyrhizobium lablabi]